MLPSLQADDTIQCIGKKGCKKKFGILVEFSVRVVQPFSVCMNLLIEVCLSAVFARSVNES